MDQWNTIANEQQLQKVKAALEANNFLVEIAESSEEAKAKALDLIPEGAEVMTATSITLETIGLVQELNESDKYNSVKKKLLSMNRETQSLEMQKIGAAAEYIIGSVHAISEDGRVVVASNSGSQLPGYVYGSAHVIWVVGAQKIVKTVDDALKRIDEYIVPKETVRARKQYNLPETWHTFPSKVTFFNREPMKGRTTIILVKEALGY
jgi:L-lactate utilization protein LutB